MTATPVPPGEGEPSKSAMSVTTTSEIPAPLQRPHVEEHPEGKRLAILTLTALGVVFGDIGTSTLYSIKDAFKSSYGLAPDPQNIFGLLSLVFWALILIVSVKYVGFILRADNRGAGGVYALLALIIESGRRVDRPSRWRGVLILLGLFGGAFLYGDGIITPAISVLGAIEGLEIYRADLRNYVVPISFGIIALLFYFQHHGTARIGGTFAWIMLAWFFSIAVLGIRGILLHPDILASMNPLHGFTFFAAHPVKSFAVLGAVVLVVTGGEALYADMGHFGRRPIRVAWFALVLPSLLLNYFGQGALLLAQPTAIENPFYLLAPSWWVMPQLVISTLAAVVASQALISGAFSLTQQAVQLGYSPRVTIVHTSKTEAGQIYIPEVNVALAVGTLMLVLIYKDSTALGQMYGVAVTGTMAITNLLFFTIARQRFGWSAFQAGAFLAFFSVIDLSLFLANLRKAESGGGVPLAIAAAVLVMMSTWKRGRMLLRDILTERSLPFEDLVASLEQGKTVRVPGTAVFLTSESEGTPVVLLHHLKHNKVLHEQVLLLSIIGKEVPEVSPADRVSIEKLPLGFWRVKAYYGFMETPNVELLRYRCAEAGIKTRRLDTTYYLGREQLIPKSGGGMQRWRKKLFALMARNSRSATEFFGIPPNRVVELGAQIEF